MKELYFNKLVVGSSLESLLFSFYNKLKIIYTRNLQPSNLEYIDDFGLGTNKKQIWDMHAFQLGMAGYIPFENKIKHIRYVDRNVISAITNSDSVIEIKFDNLYVFDDYNFLDLPVSLTSTSEECRIFDWFKADIGKRKIVENVQQDSKFINQIIFYDSLNKKDICVVSYSKKDEIEKYPEHLVKIKTQSLLSPQFPKLELDHIERKITDLGKNVYEDFDNVIFVYTDAKLMYDFHRRWVKIDYMKYLRMKLGLSND